MSMNSYAQLLESIQALPEKERPQAALDAWNGQPFSLRFQMQLWYYHR
jgi:hypothetical protein